jgi:quercetin dioxygenase-like cupin family protein
MIRYEYSQHHGHFGTQYSFERVGEEVPAHQHGIGEGHTIRCLQGSVIFKTEEFEIEINPDDEEFFFAPLIKHSIVATADHTIIFNRMESPPDNQEELLGTGDIVYL